MKWIGRISLILILISLTALAALPYLDTIRKKWDHFQKAWELVNSDPAKIEEIEKESPDSEEPVAIRKSQLGAGCPNARDVNLRQALPGKSEI